MEECGRGEEEMVYHDDLEKFYHHIRTLREKSFEIDTQQANI